MRERSFFAEAVLILSALLAGCSTASSRKSGSHHGLFDRLGLAKPSHGNPGADVEPSREIASTYRKAGILWPLKSVTVTSLFGKRGDGFHEGIDLRAVTGTPIFAAQSGKVLYADRKIRGYGRMVVIQHANGIATVYAHASRILVHKGQKVKQGQKIAISGASGHTTGPHLHFEIRYGVSAVDPLKVLPRTEAASVEVPPAESRALASRE